MSAPVNMNAAPQYVVMYGDVRLAVIEVHEVLPTHVSFGGRTVALSPDVRATVDGVGSWSSSPDDMFPAGFEVRIMKTGVWKCDCGKMIGPSEAA